MSEDVRRAITEEERVRIQVARVLGKTCGACGRALAEGETVWIERRPAWERAHWRRPRIPVALPVCAECTSPAFRADTVGSEPAPCANCGCGVFYQVRSPRRHQVLCSKRCGLRLRQLRPKEKEANES